MKAGMPADLGSLKKAMQIHQLSFSPDGTVRAKLMPNDEEDFFVDVQVTRRNVLTGGE